MAPIPTSQLDAGDDSPKLARASLLLAVEAINELYSFLDPDTNTTLLAIARPIIVTGGGAFQGGTQRSSLISGVYPGVDSSGHADLTLADLTANANNRITRAYSSAGGGFNLGFSNDDFSAVSAFLTVARLANAATTLELTAQTINLTGQVVVSSALSAASFTGDGSAITNLNASALQSGTVPVAHLGTGSPTSTNFLRGDGTWASTVSAVTVTAANGVSATVANQGSTPALTFSLGAITPTSINSSGTAFTGSGAALTNLNATAISSGRVGTAFLGSGTADTTTYLRGDGTWQPVAGTGAATSVSATATVPTVSASTSGIYMGTDSGTPTIPRQYWVNSAAPANHRTWGATVSSTGLFTLSSYDDAQGAVASILQLVATTADASLTTIASNGFTFSPPAPAGATATGSAVTITAMAGGSSSGGGGTVNITGGSTSTASNAGNVNLAGGAASSTGHAGGVTLTGANSTGGIGGGLALQGGNGVTAGTITITAGNTNTDGNSGGPITITAGVGQNAGAGGILNLVGGAGGSAGTGGAISVLTGAGGSTSGGSGALTLRTGAVVSGAVGNITIQPGSGGSSGGTINILGASGLAGAINITAGLGGTGANGGAVNLTGGLGDAGTGGQGGRVNITGGAGQGATGAVVGGDVIITGGLGAGTWAGGGITIRGGNGGPTSGTTGPVDVRSGQASGGALNSGSASIGTGSPGATGASGATSVFSGPGGSTSGASGAVVISSGATTNGASGGVSVTVGNTTTGGNPGTLSLQGGNNTNTAASQTGGPITITAGNTSGSSGQAGTLTLTAGSQLSAGGGAGGTIQLTGGGQLSANIPGRVNITGGAGTTGGAAGGAVTISGGSYAGNQVAAGAGSVTVQGGTVTSASGAGGGVSIIGTAGAGNSIGGAVALTAGGAQGTGNAGAVTLQAGNNNSSGNGGSIVLTTGSSSSGAAGGITLNIGGTDRLYVVSATSVAVQPAGDNTLSAGAPSARFSVVYAGTGTINTSDENLKTDFQTLSAAETRVAQAAKKLLKKYKFKDSVADKGPDGARWHFGIGAQSLAMAFEAEGLDANDYGMFCRDSWYEVNGSPMDADKVAYTKDSEGAVLVVRYGVRYDELLVFIVAAL
jgi:hypothetical protein